MLLAAVDEANGGCVARHAAAQSLDLSGSNTAGRVSFQVEARPVRLRAVAARGTVSHGTPTTSRPPAIETWA